MTPDEFSMLLETDFNARVLLMVQEAYNDGLIACIEDGIDILRPIYFNCRPMWRVREACNKALMWLRTKGVNYRSAEDSSTGELSLA